MDPDRFFHDPRYDEQLKAFVPGHMDDGGRPDLMGDAYARSLAATQAPFKQGGEDHATYDDLAMNKDALLEKVLESFSTLQQQQPDGLQQEPGSTLGRLRGSHATTTTATSKLSSHPLAIFCFENKEHIFINVAIFLVLIVCLRLILQFAFARR